MPSNKYYAIYYGVKCPFVTESWTEAEKFVKGCNGALFKSFTLLEDAQYFALFGETKNDEQTKHNQLSAQINVWKSLPNMKTTLYDIRALDPNEKKTIRKKRKQDEIETTATEPKKQKLDAESKNLDEPKKEKDESKQQNESVEQLVKMEEEFKTNKQTIEVYTDGSSKHMAGQRVGGCGVYWIGENNSVEYHSAALKMDPPTNQHAELCAIYWALKLFDEHQQQKQNTTANKLQNMVIYTDSQWSINCLTEFFEGWIRKFGMGQWKTAKGEPVKYQKLILLMKSILNKYDGRISVLWVKGHDNCRGNIVADGLATKGTSSSNEFRY